MDQETQATTGPGLAKPILATLGLLVVVSLLLGLSTNLARQLGSPLPVAPVVRASMNVAEKHAQDELASTKRQVDRATNVLAFANRFAIPVELSASIYDAALAEGITPTFRRTGTSLEKPRENFSSLAFSRDNIGPVDPVPGVGPDQWSSSTLLYMWSFLLSSEVPRP